MTFSTNVKVRRLLGLITAPSNATNSMHEHRLNQFGKVNRFPYESDMLVWAFIPKRGKYTVRKNQFDWCHRINFRCFCTKPYFKNWWPTYLPEQRMFYRDRQTQIPILRRYNLQHPTADCSVNSQGVFDSISGELNMTETHGNGISDKLLRLLKRS